jgi:hypothetical protein
VTRPVEARQQLDIYVRHAPPRPGMLIALNRLCGLQVRCSIELKPTQHCCNGGICQNSGPIFPASR